MRLKIRSELVIEATGEGGVVLLNVEAQRNDYQRVLGETLSVNPSTPIAAHQVPETGNRYSRLSLSQGMYKIAYEAEVFTELHVDSAEDVLQSSLADLPFDVIPHLYPSRYCPSDEMSSFAFEQFSGAGQGLQLVRSISDWVHEHIEYKAGVSTGTTTAADTFASRAGVCRDFAHLSITLCRALGIPARYVSAYALDLQPPDFHAVFEAYLCDRWYLFDSTKLCPLDGFVRIGVGRDAADTAFLTYFGQLTPQTPMVSVSRLDDGDHVSPDNAISTASV